MPEAPKQPTHAPAFKAKGPGVKWPKAKGNPKISGGLYPQALEQGRMLEQSLGDAMYWLKNIKAELQEKIISYIKMQLLAITAKLPDSVRPGALVAKIMDIVNKIQQLIADVAAVVAAIQQCIGMLISMINNLKAMIQSTLNALAALLAELCNWNLPDLPSLPNLFGPFMDFPGFNLPKMSNIDMKFSFNFSMKDCKIHLPNLDIFRNQPLGFMITAVDGTPLFHTPKPLNLPYSGQIVQPDKLLDYTYREQLRQRVDPVFDVTFASGDRIGSLPDPNKIVSGYHLTPEEYKDNALSLVLPDLIPQPGDLDYLDEASGLDGSGGPGGTSLDRFGKIKAELKLRVNLGILADTKDPNRAALWLFWVSANRSSRGGIWTPQNEETYNELVKPSLDWLASNPVPFHNLFGEGPTKSSPEGLPLMDLLEDPESLWRLSFVEAGLLDMERNPRWDSSSTDDRIPDWFRYLRSNTWETLQVKCPVGVVEFGHDRTWSNVLETMVTKASSDIEFHTEWRTQRPQFKYVYDEFANARETDRFTQFWKEVEDNYSTLLKEDSPLQDFIFSDYRILDSAVNPLGDPTLYRYLREDWLTRDQSWFLGRWIPNIPKGSPTLDSDFKPTVEQSGWSGLPDEPVFDAQAFLDRPDVRALPLNHQLTLLQLNQNYATFMKASTETLQAMEEALRDAEEEVKNLSVIGFSAKTARPRQVQNILSPVTFDEITGASQSSFTKFTIPSAGKWTLAFGLNFSAVSIPAVRSVSTLVNGKQVFLDQSDSTKEEVELALSNVYDFKVGDEVEILVSQTAQSEGMELLSGSSVNFILADIPDPGAQPVLDSSSGGSLPQTGSGNTQGSLAVNGITDFNAGMDLPFLSVVAVHEDRRAYVINPTVPSNEPPYYDGIAVTPAAEGEKVSVVTVYGTVLTLQGANFSPGGLVYVGANGSLTQDYSTLLSTTHWVIVVGRAHDANTLIYEPHIPTNVLMRFN